MSYASTAPIDRFMAKVNKTETCWLWTGGIYPNGYGTFADGWGARITTLAHRASYRFFKGEIPKGLTIDHLCRVKHCVNPTHLEAVTQRENGYRSPFTPSTINKNKTVCLRGHKFDTLQKKGRACKKCHAINQLAYTERKKAGVS